MKFFGYLRVKNEARWIERVIRSIQPLCERIFVFDDHSDDATGEICESLGCRVFPSPFKKGEWHGNALQLGVNIIGRVNEDSRGWYIEDMRSRRDVWTCRFKTRDEAVVIADDILHVNETRDKNYLLQHVWQEAAPAECGKNSDHWIIAIDGDEELEANGPALIKQAIKPEIHALTLRIVYLWDRDDQIRTDGIYGKFTRGSVFQMVSPLHSFRSTDGRTNFHCGSVPNELLGRVAKCPARLLHYGYRDRADRVRKFGWYNALDAGNRAEDLYRHMVQGDVPEIPASEKLMHAGPLELVSL